VLSLLALFLFGSFDAVGVLTFFAYEINLKLKEYDLLTPKKPKKKDNK